jgi:hypothetical protein
MHIAINYNSINRFVVSRAVCITSLNHIYIYLKHKLYTVPVSDERIVNAV